MAGKSDSGVINILGNSLEQFKVDANEAICFKLVHQETDITNDSIVFNPDMTHQLFGDSEQIFGYKDLQVNIYCTAASLKTYIEMKYSEKVSPTLTDGVQADDVFKMLAPHFLGGFITNIDDFSMALQKDAHFKPFGQKVHSYQSRGHEFEIYQTSIDEPGFRSFHERIQPFLLFYVDAASFIDVDDDRWAYYLVFEKCSVNSSVPHAFVGYMTVYNYYAYPCHTRPRISQALVMPPYQRQGHMAVLLQTFYNLVLHRPEVLDITVEDPSDSFQRVRDFVDAKNCQSLAAFQPPYLLASFSAAMTAEAREQLKLNKKQIRRIYEILRLRALNPHDKRGLRNFRLDVKRRLNVPFQRNGRDLCKLRKVLNTDELAATVNNLDHEHRMNYLSAQYALLVDDYQKVVNRLQQSMWD